MLFKCQGCLKSVELNEAIITKDLTIYCPKCANREYLLAKRVAFRLIFVGILTIVAYYL